MTRGLKYPPFAKPAPQQESRAAESVSREETLPSIDDFLDELPAIDDFLLGEEDYVADQQVESYPAETEAEAATEEGWAAGAWQSYDWSSVASLNRSTSSAMDSSDAWSDSEWPEPVAHNHSARATDNPSADEIANALDGIAYRIRSGELVIDNLHGTPPEAAMAAALAVLLRMRG